MKIYKVWVADHRMTYVTAYFFNKEDAKKFFKALFPVTASGPDSGVDEIEIKGPVTCPHCKKTL